MRCDEIQAMRGPYLDSELEATTSLEIEQHLKSCPECARLFAEEQTVEGGIKAALNQGHRTAAVWDQIERSVVAAAKPAAYSRHSPDLLESAGWHSMFLALGEHLRAGWCRSPRAWTALAAMWGVIAVVNFTARDPASPQMANRAMPSDAEIRSAWQQKQQMIAELAMTSEPAPAPKPKAAPPGPRSDRRNETLNS